MTRSQRLVLLLVLAAVVPGSGSVGHAQASTSEPPPAGTGVAFPDWTAAPRGVKKQVETAHDRLGDSLTVVARVLRTTSGGALCGISFGVGCERFRIEALARAPGGPVQARAFPSVVRLTFAWEAEADARGRTPEADATLLLLADSLRLRYASRLDTIGWSVQDDTWRYLAQRSVDIPFPEFARMALSRATVGRLAGTEFELDRSEQAVLREVLRLLVPAGVKELTPEQSRVLAEQAAQTSRPPASQTPAIATPPSPTTTGMTSPTGFAPLTPAQQQLAKRLEGAWADAETLGGELYLRFVPGGKVVIYPHAKQRRLTTVYYGFAGDALPTLLLAGPPARRTELRLLAIDVQALTVIDGGRERVLHRVGLSEAQTIEERHRRTEVRSAASMTE